MKATCPSCAASFLVEPEQLGPTGRKVRCGECGHSWHQAPPSDAATESAIDSATETATQSAAWAAEPFAPAAEPAREVEVDEGPEPVAAPEAPAAESREAARAPLPEPERPSRLSRPRPVPPRREVGLALGWLLYVVVVAALVTGFVFGRAQLVATVPEMERLYDLVGLPARPEALGLELREVKSVRRLVDGERVVVIEGLVANVSDRPKAVPTLRASLTDPNGLELDRWTFQALEATLPPGKTTSFETVARNPPREGNLSIDFVVAE